MVTSWNWQCLIKNNLFVENKYRSIQPLALVVLGIINQPEESIKLGLSDILDPSPCLYFFRYSL